MSLELLIYLALAGFAFLFALGVTGRIMHAYGISKLLGLDCIGAVRNASATGAIGGRGFLCS